MQNKTKKLIKGSLASALFSPDLNLASGPFPLMRGSMNKRTEALFDFKRQLVKMYDFINETGPKAQINLIDPEQVKFQELCYGIESSLEWLSQEIEKEEDKDCEFIDDTENLYRVGE